MASLKPTTSAPVKVNEATRALLRSVLDYAGIFPPAQVNPNAIVEVLHESSADAFTFLAGGLAWRDRTSVEDLERLRIL